MSDDGAARRRRRRRGFVLGAGATGVLLALLVGEVTLRVLGTTSEPRRHFRPGIYASSDTLGWQLVPDYDGVHLEYSFEARTRTNPDGYRGLAWSAERREASLRVLALGDSCTFGRGVADGESFPAQLEQLLGERGEQAAVFNAGVPGYDTQQELATLRRLGPELKPQRVILTWLPNDVIERSVDQIGVVQIMDGQLVHDVEKYIAWRDKVDHKGLYRSALYRFFRVRSKALMANLGDRRAKWETDGLGPEQLAYSTAPLLEVAQECQSLGARLLLVLLPRQEEVEDAALSLHHYDHMASFAREHGIDVLDLAHRWREEGPVNGRYLERDAVHPTPSGYRDVAEAILTTPVFATE